MDLAAAERGGGAVILTPYKADEEPENHKFKELKVPGTYECKIQFQKFFAM